jgi:Histidine kinase-, DNA gyrase B-, and HSP90-like ATPase
VNWFAPDPSRSHGAGQQRASQQGAGQQAAGHHGPFQYGVDEYGRQLGHTAVLTPTAPAPPVPVQPAAPPAAPEVITDVAPPSLRSEVPELRRMDVPWPHICDQFGLHLLVLAEQLRTSLDELEADEDDPDRLKRLYQVDHAVTRMRRASRDLRTLAGRSEEELAGFTTSLLDVIRMAASAIERYTQVTVGKVSELAVLGYAADDIGSVMAALLDNATRYSPGTVTVSGHLLDDGGVMFRIEDSGIGMGAEQVNALNEMFVGPVPEVDERTGRHTGFPVVHRIAHKHDLRVRLAARPLPSSGTVAMVILPPHLLCEVPAEEARRTPAVPAYQQASIRQSPIPDQPRSELPARDAGADAGRGRIRLPRRERGSLRGDEPRPAKREPGMVPTAKQQAAARRAFADDLSAFSLGAEGVDGPDGPDDGGAWAVVEFEDAATSATSATEEAQP